ncbi:MAG: PqiC family protein [Burkholderiaceae bacterium]|nr:PqiC family protein [Burkholderiaceae bacterium]MCD8516143.1 PqiC family protein [Burkholderiaceae bacterium]MCD8537828.1 PqiC family protein [Burkholderiaceae bacterium]MCD8566150.1 PqiC family protein [Burkholderiaceae bacterium]
MIKKLGFIGVMMFWLVGCASQPNVYYTLTAPASNEQTKRSALTSVGLYTIASVSVPSPVDDTLIIVRQSGDQLMKLAHDRWTAPLGKQFNNALAVALTHELGMPPVSKTQASGDKRVTSLSIDVQRFDLVPGQYAELAVVWQVVPASTSNKAGRLVCYTQVREMVEPGVAPLVKAQQLNIQKLAQAISRGWQTGQSGPGTRCQ